MKKNLLGSGAKVVALAMLVTVATAEKSRAAISVDDYAECLTFLSQKNPKFNSAIFRNGELNVQRARAHARAVIVRYFGPSGVISLAQFSGSTGALSEQELQLAKISIFGVLAVTQQIIKELDCWNLLDNYRVDGRERSRWLLSSKNRRLLLEKRRKMKRLMTIADRKKIAIDAELAKRQIASTALGHLPYMFVQFGLGTTFPLQDRNLDPFLQAARQKPGFVGTFDLGLILPPSHIAIDPGTFYLALILRAMYGQVTNDRLVNQTFPGFLNTSGHTSFYGFIPMVAAYVPFDDRWTGRVFGGVGVGHQEFTMRNAGVRIAHASDTSLMWQAGIGAEYKFTPRTSLGLELAYTGLEKLRGNTNTNVPFALAKFQGLTFQMNVRIALGEAKNF